MTATTDVGTPGSGAERDAANSAAKSAANSATSSATSGAPKSLPARLIGVLFTPRAAYADVAARPRWLATFLVVFLVSAAAATTFMSTEVGRNAVIDQQVTQTQSWTGRPPTQQQLDQLDRMSRYFVYTAPAFQLVFFIFASVVVSGIAFAIFSAMLGGDAKFKQVYAVVVHSGVVLAALALFTTPLAYARQTLSTATNLAVFFPFLDEASFAARLLGSIDLIYIWWMISLSIGLGVLYRKRTGPIATSLILVYVALAVVVAAVKTAVSGA